MPEGDTLYRTAETLRRALRGKTVTGFDTDQDIVRMIDRRLPVVGRCVAAVESHGKHLLIVLRPADAPPAPGEGQGPKAPEGFPVDLALGDLVLHSHLRMTGSWHIYRPGEAWRKPRANMRVALATADFVAPCFSAPVVELLTAREAVRHPMLASRGGSVIDDDFDSDDAFRRLRARADMPIGVAIMDQRALAGVGNVFKSEVLFLERISPFVMVAELTDDQVRALIARSEQLLRLNRGGGMRRTNFGLDRSQPLWAYGRSGEPCRICGARIACRRQGLDGRTTYYCPACQHTGNVGAAGHVP